MISKENGLLNLEKNMWINLCTHITKVSTTLKEATKDIITC